MPSPQARVFQLPTGLERLYEGLEDIGMGPRFMSVIRKGEWHLEIGGPRNDFISFLFLEMTSRPGEVVDGKVELIGPDISETPPETSLPGGLYFRVFGKDLNEDYYEYLVRMMILALTETEGLWCQGPELSLWLRVSKKMAPRLSFVKIAQAVRAFLMVSIPMVEAVEARIVVGAPEAGGKDLVAEIREEIRAKKQALEARFLTIGDEDVDYFYGCVLCKNFAPNHVCIITPSTIPYCGIVSYYGAKAAYSIDPQGYIFEIPKGETLDPILGHYSGVDEAVFRRSAGTVKRVYLNSAIKYTTTNCGCFEAAAFYIPEVDGIGIVHRRYFGDVPIGLPFSKIAGMISGGRQVHGFKGISIRGMRMANFLSGDGGWERIVWMPKDLKTEVGDAIPEELYDKIATEEDALTPEELKAFLKAKGHPITKRFWKEGEPHPLSIPPPGSDWPDEK